MNSRAKSHTRLVILAALVLLTSAGVAVAAIPAQDGAISACYDSKGNLRVIDAGQSCAKSETPLTWNQQGPPGVQGLPGQDGEDGEDGAPGPGLASVEDLEGLPCRVGEPDEGTLDVEYAAATDTARGVTILCTASTLHTLTVDQPTGGKVTGGPIDCGSTCSAPFANGAEVQLTASASPGYTFSGWTGACSGTGTCTVTMDGERQVGATFTRRYELIVTVHLSGGVLGGTKDISITSQPSGLSFCEASTSFGITFQCQGLFNEGQVTLTRTGSATNAVWTGCTPAGTSTCVVTLNSNKSVEVFAS